MQQPSSSIDPAAHIGLVSLRVADLARSLNFYEEVLGFQRIEETAQRAVLAGQDRLPLLALQELAGAAPQPLRSTGLYHVAILLPTRPDLGRLLQRMIDAGLEIGQGDHLVSEALYISDPDLNGLELYQDRPRSQWNWTGSSVQMASDPVDLTSLLDEGQRLAGSWQILPAGTRVGHIHLRVGEIAPAEHFYHTILGFDVTARWPGALFVSAGGYHHHIGLNTWQSRGAGAAPQTTAGLETFVIVLPDAQALAAVRARLVANAQPFQQDRERIGVNDPWGNRVRLQVESSIN